jgi:ketosteroid isomerase-like protein
MWGRAPRASSRLGRRGPRGLRLADRQVQSLDHAHRLDVVYNQHYSFVIEFRAGKICAVREYIDTQHAYEVWFAKP